MENTEMKTGTTTMGLVCKDGLVLAADKRATSGYLISWKKFDKIISITDSIAVTVAGSGSVMVFGVLETLYKKGLSVEEGVKLAAKGVNAAVQRDIASGNGIDIVTVTKDGVKKVFSKELEVRIEQ